MKTKLKNLAEIQTGVFARTVAKGDAAYLQPKYFDDSGRLTITLAPDLNTFDMADKHLLQQGDVLFAAKGSKNFATCFDFESMPAAASTSFFVIRLIDDSILPEYLTWFLNHPSTIEFLKRHARGTRIQSISKSVLNDLSIPRPSLERQSLVAKIDKLRSSEKKLKTKIEALRETQIQYLLFNTLKENL